MTHQRRKKLTGAAIEEPTEDTGEGTEGTAPVITWSNRTTGAAQYTVAKEAVMLVVDRTGRISEAEVCKGAMEIKPTPPHQAGQRMRGGGQNFRDRGRSA